MTKPPKYTERDLERATVELHDTRHHRSIELLAEVYMDERERFAKIADDFAWAQRARGFEVRARAAEEIAELIRADRGGL